MKVTMMVALMMMMMMMMMLVVSLGVYHRLDGVTLGLGLL
jgi:hypothetical protein